MAVIKGKVSDIKSMMWYWEHDDLLRAERERDHTPSIYAAADALCDAPEHEKTAAVNALWEHADG